MLDPNVLNYFLIILGGFGVVWSFRRTTKQENKKIGEFEYAAFSAIWGIPVFLVFLEGTKLKPGLLESIFVVPMMGTLIVCPLGVLFGYLGGEVFKLAFALWKRFKNS